MSKFVKDMITKDLRNRLNGVEDALLVDVIGLKNDKNVALRQRLRKKNIHLLVIKNSLAARATQGTRLEKAFDNTGGTMAIVWGGEDIISLAKEVITIADDKNFAAFAPKGGVMDGQSLAAEQVRAVSKWMAAVRLSTACSKEPAPARTVRFCCKTDWSCSRCFSCSCTSPRAWAGLVNFSRYLRIPRRHRRAQWLWWRRVG